MTSIAQPGAGPVVRHAQATARRGQTTVYSGQWRGVENGSFASYCADEPEGAA